MHKSKDPSYLSTLAHFILLQGTTSTSENYRIALQYANTTQPNKRPVLFVFPVHNY